MAPVKWQYTRNRNVGKIQCTYTIDGSKCSFQINIAPMEKRMTANTFVKQGDIVA